MAETLRRSTVIIRHGMHIITGRMGPADNVLAVFRLYVEGECTGYRIHYFEDTRSIRVASPLPLGDNFGRAMREVVRNGKK